MRHRSLISNERGSARVNVTPMIDVVMVLIVFYLLVGQLALDRRASITLPVTRTGIDETDSMDPVIVGVRADGTRTLNGIDSELDRIEAMITGVLARSPDTPIRIRADHDAPFGVVRPVLNALRDMGVGKIELVTEQQP